ncbi:contactin [Lingula anatina]|uniref:Contactin n=1 Tax=Lingula anatina TaxID=7574 RepID=A0A2R2ML41_LINAN|nr:contactin [Lingula anatina]|eukprot:XP_023930782.1 contactin [Lingula anatina]
MEIRLECFAWGTNNLFYQWGRTDGKNMPRRAITKDNNRVVIIPSVELADEGTYECRVQREFGQTATGTVTITLEAEPYFLVSWKDEFVDQGDSVSWSCRANGKPEVDYFWFKNGLPLSENTLPANEVGRFSWTQRKDRLTIQNLKQWDSAMYQCGAKNQYAMRYLTRELKVMRFAPSFIKNPVDPNQFAVQGGNVTIVCQPEAAPKVQVEKITWKKDGGSLTLTGGGRISKLPNGNLLIRSVQYSDRGNYTCVAENDVGSAESTGFLTVVESTSLQMKPSEQSPPIRTTYVGQNLTLYCLATVNPLLDLNYIWRFNDRDIDFEGKYDQYGLRVEEPDRYWQRGIGEYRGNLLIYPVTFDVEGWYECIAKTPADQASAKVELRVEGPPGQPSGIECVTLNSSSVNVTWFPGPDHRSAIQQYKIEGYNTAEGIWKTAKEPEMITQAELGARRATVTGLNPWSTYKFRLLAKNGYGWGEPSKPSPMVTTAQSIPARPVRNITRAVDSKVGTLVVEWEPLPRWEQHGNNTKYKIYYRKNQQGKVSDLDWSTGIVDDPGHRFATTVGVDNTYTLYDIKIQSMNVKGTSDALISPIVEIRSAMGLPVAVPKDIVAEQYNATALEVTWIPVQNTFVNLKGVLAGYRINYWVRGRENSLMAEVATIPGDVDRGLIVGLYPDTYYEVTVMVYNEAGNGEPSQPYPQKTLRQPPKDYPTEVELHNVDTHTIKVSWRGISTDQTEEPLQGYKVKYWRTSEKIIDAKDFDAGKDTFATISDLSAGESYYLRVYGYSRGGQGAMSSPMVMFVMAKSGCTYTQIIPEASYVEKCGSCQHVASVLLLVTALLAQILKTIL